MNPGFDAGVLHPWTQSGGSKFAEDWQVSSDALFGPWSAAGIGRRELRQDLTEPIETASVNHLTVWYKSEEPTHLAIRVYYDDGSNDRFLIVTSTLWTSIDLAPELAGSKNLAGISFSGLPGQGFNESRIWIDNVSLDSGQDDGNNPEPATLLTLSGGLLALGMLRRRRRARS